MHETGNRAKGARLFRESFFVLEVSCLWDAIWTGLKKLNAHFDAVI
jgi:hypothetical protein